MIEIIAPYLSAISTVLGLTAFLLIIWWAWSKKRQPANQASAELPFDLPDEFTKEKK
jgi:cytochrome c oxidase cbb3-type subunit 4